MARNISVCRRSGYGSVAAPTCPSPFPSSRAVCIDGRICAFARAGRSRLGDCIWATAVCGTAHTGSAVKARPVPISHSASARQRVSVSRCWPSDLTGTCEALRPAPHNQWWRASSAGPANVARVVLARSGPRANRRVTGRVPSRTIAHQSSRLWQTPRRAGSALPPLYRPARSSQQVRKGRTAG